MRVAIIGCGFIGQKRARLLGPHKLTFAVDTVLARAQALAAGHDNCRATVSWQDAVSSANVDVVFVSVIHKYLAEITHAAVENGKHVMVDKPAGTRPEELDATIELAARKGVKVRTGFNHRFHPAMQKAHALITSGAIGPLMFIRGRYGHGGRPGYEKEWRADPDLGGGGELLDQGMHLIDLSRWFLNADFVHIDGHINTYYWDMPVEDNAFMLLRTAANQTAWLHVSWTEWKNVFSLEIYGRDGKLQIEGLGGSYGVEQLAHYRMLPEMGPPETTIWQFPGEDKSWALELQEFIHDIEQDRQPNPGLTDARAALHVVQSIYKRSEQGDHFTQSAKDFSGRRRDGSPVLL
jgi:predicted dehydrogenase